MPIKPISQTILPRTVVPHKSAASAPRVLRTVKSVQPAVAAPVSPEVLLTQAQQLADAGRFAAAQAQCERALSAQGPSSRTYYLMGLIDDAAGREVEAEAFYRKALYLEPEHYEALVQLSLLEKKRGDARAAHTLDERARRVRAKAQERAI